MAKIRSLEKGTSNVRARHTEVDCTYQVVDDEEHGFLLTLATYGSDTRASESKVSQILQIDQEFAWKLVEVINGVFGSKTP